MEISKRYDIDPLMVLGMVREARKVDIESIVAKRLLSWQKESRAYFESIETDYRRGIESRSVSELSDDIRIRLKELSSLHDSLERKIELSQMVYFLYSRRRQGRFTNKEV